MRQRIALIASAVFLLIGCQTPAAYRFHLVREGGVGPEGVIENDDVRVVLSLDPTGARSIEMSVTNKTDAVMQVNWKQLVVIDAFGAVTQPRPESDVGWLAAGTTQSVVLSPFALPRGGLAAHAYEGQRLEVRVPIVIRNEPKPYAFAFIADVKDSTETEKE